MMPLRSLNSNVIIINPDSSTTNNGAARSSKPVANNNNGKSSFYNDFSLPLLKSATPEQFASQLRECIVRVSSRGDTNKSAQDLKDLLRISFSKVEQLGHSEATIEAFFVFVQVVGVRFLKNIIGNDKFLEFLNDNHFFELCSLCLLPRIVQTELDASQQTSENSAPVSCENSAVASYHDLIIVVSVELASLLADPKAADFLHSEVYFSLVTELFASASFDDDRANLANHVSSLLTSSDFGLLISPAHARHIIRGTARLLKSTSLIYARTGCYFVLNVLLRLFSTHKNADIFVHEGLFDGIAQEILPSLAANIDLVFVDNACGDKDYNYLPFLALVAKNIRSFPISAIQAASESGQQYTVNASASGTNSSVVLKYRFVLELAYLITLKGYNVPEYFNRENIKRPFAFFDRCKKPVEVARCVSDVVQSLGESFDDLLETSSALQWALSSHHLLRHLPGSYIQNPEVFGLSFIRPINNKNYRYDDFSGLPKVPEMKKN